MQLKKPKMIMFDYGHTLLHESGYSTLRGNEALMRHAVKNPRNLTAQEVMAFGNNLYRSSPYAAARDMEVEVQQTVFNCLLYETLQIEFDLSPFEVERVFWEGCSMGGLMPEVEPMLDYLAKTGMRTAVVSNIMHSGAALKQRIDRLLPNNRFEFVLSSSDCGIRKPNALIFNLALARANIDAGDVWFCGDNPAVDIAGANGVGIFPVWYHNQMPCDYRDKTLDKPPPFPHLCINEWPELIEILRNL